jgi:hypothetical protein
MSGFFTTLWDMLRPPARVAEQKVAEPKTAEAKVVEPKVTERPVVREAPSSPRRKQAKGREKAPTKAERFEAIARVQLERYEIRVRKWRSGMTGIAWYVTYADGRVQRLIEAPRPKTEMSLAILLHEVGHHAIGFNTYKPRCLEEYHAWQYAFRAMAEHGVEITESVKRRYDASMRYAIGKATRRGIKAIPVELAGFVGERV